uniref:KRAB domain-containing protein n=1 Tax=Crocodylus porosus TaxID=8502 RepID=A0A7M4E022_CROPO
MAKLQAAEMSLYTIVAAIQAMERKVESYAKWLLSLDGRTGVAEKKISEREKMEMEFGNQLATLGAVIQENHLAEEAGERGEPAEERELLDPVAPPRGAGQSKSGRDWQKELYKNVMKGNFETLLSLDYTVSRPDILSWMEENP